MDYVKGAVLETPEGHRHRETPSFPLFTRLPRELRDMIWDLAMRALDQPAAHFFSVYRRLPGDELWPARLPGHNSLDRFPDFLANYLLPPHVPPPSSAVAGGGGQRMAPSTVWDEPSNPSAYLVDCALWHACGESHAAMVRRFRRPGEASEVTPCPPDGGGARDSCFPPRSCFATIVVSDPRGRRTWLSVRPKTDLFCLQPVWFRAIMWDLLLDFSGMAFAPDGSPIKACHIALELRDGNPSASSTRLPQLWEIDESRWREEIQRRRAADEKLEQVAKAAVEMQCETLWLIDYGLKDTQSWRDERSKNGKDGEEDKGNEAAPPERRMFFARDRRFVDVTDAGEAFKDAHSEEQWHGTGYYYVQRLYEVIDDFFHRPHNRRWGYTPVGLKRPKLGILACEVD